MPRRDSAGPHFSWLPWCLPASYDHRGGPLRRRPCPCSDTAVLIACVLFTSPSQPPSTALGGRGDGHQYHHSGKLGNENISTLTSLQLLGLEHHLHQPPLAAQRRQHRRRSRHILTSLQSLAPNREPMPSTTCCGGGYIGGYASSGKICSQPEADRGNAAQIPGDASATVTTDLTMSNGVKRS